MPKQQYETLAQSCSGCLSLCRRLYRHWGILLGIITMLFGSSACVTLPIRSRLNPPRPTTQVPWVVREKRLRDLQCWSVRGAFLGEVKQPGQRTKRASANFVWRQQGDHFNLTFFGPFGLGAVKLHGEPGRVVLKRGRKPAQVADTPETLLRSLMGWSPPFSKWLAWIKGLPAFGYAAELTWDEHGRIAELAQAGWQVTYVHYGHYGRYELPETLMLAQENRAAKVALHAWQPCRAE